MIINRSRSLDTILFTEKLDEVISFATSYEAWRNFYGTEDFYPRFSKKNISNLRRKAIRDFERGMSENYLINRTEAQIYQVGELQYKEEYEFELPPPPPEIILVKP